MGSLTTKETQFLNEADRTNDPEMDKNFIYIHNNWASVDDYADYKEWDQDDLVRMFAVKTAISCSMSLICIIFNSLLLLFFAFEKSFRKLNFCPVVAQAVIDLLGPGLANFVYEIWSYATVSGDFGHWAVVVFEVKGIEFSLVEGISRLRNWPGCFLSFLRILMNEYTTGMCVLATSLIRYLLICHPTTTLPENKVFLLSLLAVIIGSGLIAMLINFGSMSMHYLTSSRDYFKMTDFIVNCDTIYYRKTARIVFESVMCLAIPATPSGYFYLRVAFKLLNRERNQSRNRNLTIAFILSWFLWIICWTPSYWAMSFDFSASNSDYENDSQSWGSRFYWLQVYFVLFRTSFQMTYSHLNAVIFLIVLKPFRVWIIEMLKKPCHSIVGKWEAIIHKTILQTLVTFSLLMFLLTTCITCFVAAPHHFKSEYFLSVNKMKYFRNNGNLRPSLIDNVVPSTGENIRSLCGLNHGRLDFQYHRCFFIGAHPVQGLNFSEQVEFCEKQQAHLSYPRSQEELEYMWKFYRSYRGWDLTTELSNTTDWYLHLGILRKGSLDDLSFTSVDEKFNFTSQSHSWFYTVIGKFQSQIKELRGPAICISNQQEFVYECLPRTRRQYSICSIDFSR